MFHFSTYRVVPNV